MGTQLPHGKGHSIRPLPFRRTLIWHGLLLSGLSLSILIFKFSILIEFSFSYLLLVTKLFRSINKDAMGEYSSFLAFCSLVNFSAI